MILPKQYCIRINGIGFRAVSGRNIPVKSVTETFRDEEGNAISAKKLAEIRRENGKVVPAKTVGVTENDARGRSVFRKKTVSIEKTGENLFDEQSTAPASNVKNYMYGTYFDEIYHARSAYEYLQGHNIYEWTHPPLGKLFIAAGISVFGMTPFGWRFAGVLFGVMMIPLLFAFAKRLFKDSFWAMFAAAIFTFDFMHYAQPRLATIDTFITFFVIAMYYFMYKYYTMSFHETKFGKTLVPLLMSGVCLGLGIACKWPGLYAALGLAVIFFITMFKRYKEYRYAVMNGIRSPALNFPRYLRNTVLLCCVFFAIIPAAIYVISYIPYYTSDANVYLNRDYNPIFKDIPFLSTLLPNGKFGNFIGDIVRIQKNMYNYHAQTGLGADHPYASVWWKWLFDVKPMFYYANTLSEAVRDGAGNVVRPAMKAGISSFGNPVVWWGGLIAGAYSLYAWIKRRNKTALFLVIAYLAQLLPWLTVDRGTYIYHYFPCTPFLALFTAYAFMDFTRNMKKAGKTAGMAVAGVYAAAVIVLFVMFFPVLSGMHVSDEYVRVFLKWFSGWALIS